MESNYYYKDIMKRFWEIQELWLKGGGSITS